MSMDWTDYASYLQNEQIRQAANDRATQAYNRAKLNGESEDRALAAAKFEWQKTMDVAGLTGYYNGSPTMGTQQWWTNQFGQWMPNAPQAGQQTLAGQGQAFNQAQALAAMYGSYFAPGSTPGAGTQTQAAQEQAFRQDLANRQLALDTATQQQTAANQYLTLLSNLRGPADWAKYQEVLGAGGNMNSLAAAAMGQYVPGGGATSGLMPQAANLNTLYGQVAGAGGYQPGGAPGGGGGWAAYNAGGNNLTGGGQSVAWTNAAAQARGDPYATATGANPQPGMVPANVQAGQQYTPQAQNQQSAQQQYNWLNPAAGNGTNTMGATQTNQMNLPAPNQVAAQSWKNLTPSQQEMMKGQWEASGWYKPDVEALMNQALPKYASNAATAGTWRLR